MKINKKNKPIVAFKLASSMFLASVMAVSIAASAASTETYNWKNVRIDGGGFVPGIVFNQKEQNLIYARTDIGGAYRWNASTSSWVPLLDWVGWDNWGWNGVLSLATDPVDTNRVYVAAGMYTNSWDPNNGAILRSTDKGATWQATPLPFKVGGNMPGRGQGERLVVDPNKNNIVYFGAEGGNGLWRSTDYGMTWAKVSSFTNGGTYAQDPADTNNYLNQLQGVTWVTFDPTSGSAGSTSQTIYVGVADKANPVYRSTDGGATWTPLAGAPTSYLAHKGVFDSVNSILYISTSDTGGPYDGAKGDVWKFDAKTGVWTNISPIPSSSTDLYFGYSGLTIDRKNPKTLMVASQVAWWPDAIFFRTTDGGATWTRIWDWTSYPSRSFRYTQDITENPWLNFGITSPVAPDTAPKLGWMNESVEIDPFNSNRLLYGTGATLYGTENLTNWDAGAQILIKPKAKGIEETAVLDLVSPPTGAPLYSALGDIGGFRHDDLTVVPSYNFATPSLTSTTSIDYAELSPSTMVRVGNLDQTGGIGITTTAGTSWWSGQVPSGVTSGGNVALSADGGAIVWSPGGTAVQVSTTFGSNWAAATGLPLGAVVESDRVNPSKFYALANGTFYVSTNKGATFTATAATGIPAAAHKFKAVYGREGDIWLAGGSTTTTYGLWHSTDSGATFTRIANVQEADNVSFGKAAPGQTYPAIYIVAKVDGVRGVFRSDDAAASWVRINDNQHQYGNIGEALSGDPRVYGRVYVGTNGRGVIWGDSSGVVTSSSASSSKSSVASSSSSSLIAGSSSSKSSVASSSSSSKSSTASVSSSSVVFSSIKSSSSSSIKSSSSSSVSSSSSSSPFAQQCNWYGTLYPVCVTTTSGWGYESGKSCIAASTCSAQPAPYGIVGASSSSVSSVVSSVKSSSSSLAPVSSSSSKSSVVSSSAPSSASSSKVSSSVSSASSSVAAASKCKYIISNEWNTGFTAAIRITNSGTTVINGWNVSWTYTDGSTVTSSWGGTVTGANPYSAVGLDWNKTIQPGQTVEVGVQGTKGSSITAQAPAVTGAACN
ncbi:MAG: cellulose-binding protein [Gammaproteobacteria bacterium]|nr:MAG: cellulose-binding protein [Gammaproteobacteria bacterium]